MHGPFMRVVALLMGGLLCNGLESDINSKLFAHMIPQFEAEEAELIASAERPAVPGETVYSLKSAIEKIHKLVAVGHVGKEQGEKLVHSLIAAEQLRKIASMVQQHAASVPTDKANIH
jgi:hypothetical protein